MAERRYKDRHVVPNPQGGWDVKKLGACGLHQASNCGRALVGLFGEGCTDFCAAGVDQNTRSRFRIGKLHKAGCGGRLVLDNHLVNPPRRCRTLVPVGPFLSGPVHRPTGAAGMRAIG